LPTQELTFRSLLAPQDFLSSCIKVKALDTKDLKSTRKTTKVLVRITRPSFRPGLRPRRITEYLKEIEISLAPDSSILFEATLNNPNCTGCNPEIFEENKSEQS
jgi:hypothetical protein